MERSLRSCWGSDPCLTPSNATLRGTARGDSEALMAILTSMQYAHLKLDYITELLLWKEDDGEEEAETES